MSIETAAHPQWDMSCIVLSIIIILFSASIYEYGEQTLHQLIGNTIVLIVLAYYYEAGLNKQAFRKKG